MQASKYLKSFEDALLKAMTKDGWDGEEDEKIIQWSFTGSLFYSIIVITTIGEYLYSFMIRLSHRVVEAELLHERKT